MRTHPIRSAILGIALFLFVTLPEWFGSVWPLFTSKTLPEWVSERRWSPLGPSGTAWLTVTSIIVMLILLAVIVYQTRPRTSVADLYTDRRDLNRSVGGLLAELDSVKKGWIMWPAGGSSVSIPSESLSHIQRLILLDPKQYSGAYAKRFLAGSAGIVSSAITDLTVRAQKAGTEVRWNPDCFLSIVIHDHFSDDAWARMELLLPGIESVDRPSIRITKKSHADLFRALVKMYEYLWNEESTAPHIG